MNHNEPVLSVNVDRCILVSDLPKKTFIIAPVFGFIYSKGEIITAISWQAFLALMGVVSCAFYICHEKSLRVQRIIGLEIEAEAILPTKLLGVNPPA